jgi:hypothetical protein
MRRHKYRAQKTALGFPSKLEEAVYFKLRDREVLGLIRDLRRQHTIVLQEGKRDTRIAWKIDFSFINCETGQLTFAEAKGFPDKVYLMKLKMFRANPQGDLEIWKGHYRSPKLVEVIKAASASK